MPCGFSVVLGHAVFCIYEALLEQMEKWQLFAPIRGWWNAEHICISRYFTISTAHSGPNSVKCSIY